MITSASNPTIKAIRKLTEHKARQQSGLFLIEGLRIVAEAIQCGAKIDSIIFSTELLVSEFGQSLIAACLAKEIPLVEVSAQVFMTLSNKDGPQGIAAVVHQSWQSLSDTSLQSGDLWVALESVQNPGNLGTVVRTSEAVGAQGIFLLDQSTDLYDPKAVKASMGAIFSLNLVKTDFQAFSTWLNHQKVGLIGSSDKAALDYMDLDYPETCILLMGSERQGLPQYYLDACTQVVRIPMLGRSDSLNLAIATSIILYQIYNQKRRKPASQG